LESNLQPAD